MKAFRVITVFNNKAQLKVMVGNTIEEVKADISDSQEIVEIKEITKNLKLDIFEIREALNYCDVNELAQLLIMALMEEYDNVT